MTRRLVDLQAALTYSATIPEALCAGAGRAVPVKLLDHGGVPGVLYSRQELVVGKIFGGIQSEEPASLCRR
jgi:hypothetical protein